MKPVHESAMVIITTSQQRQLIESLMKKHLDEGGSVFAQVFHDGFRVRVLTPEKSKSLQQAISHAVGKPLSAPHRHSAFDKTNDEGGAV